MTMPPSDTHDAGPRGAGGQVQDPLLEQLRENAQAKLRAGRAAVPIFIEAEPVEPDDPEAASVHSRTNRKGFHRLWAAVLFCRALDGYDAVLRLEEAGLDIEARAHSRIAFEHLISFAWVVAKPKEIQRPLRIERCGMRFLERQQVELAEYREWLPRQHRVGLANEVNGGPLPERPETQNLCRQLDLELVPYVKGLRAGTENSFSAWYSYLYRGASAFVHPTLASFDPLIKRAPGGVEIAPPPKAVGITTIEVLTHHLDATLRIARARAPWLVDEEAV